MNLHIEKIVYGGNGLAHTEDNIAVFVPFTLPDETVEASLDDTKKDFANAAIERIITASPDRVAPRCEHFGHCGGCHYQHATYPAQLEIKRSILEESLERAGLAELPAIAIQSGEPWEYRNRIRLRIAKIDDKLRAGYLRRGSTEFLPIHMCPIASPLLWRAAETLTSLEGQAAHWMHATEEIELFTNQSRLQLTLFLRKEPSKHFAQFCEAAQAKIPELTGAGVALIEHEGRSRKALRIRAGSSWGGSGLKYTVAGESYWVSRGAFFQVNRTLLNSLVALVTGNRRGDLAWDLYAGVGLFSRVLAKSFAEVVAVEASAADLIKSFNGKGRRAIEATTVEFLRQTALQRDRPDLVVLDPPRAGIGPEACTLLARIRPREIAYVSCDPVTLGRDLKMMVDSGYRLDELHMVDMFPQTFHQETVAVLRL